MEHVRGLSQAIVLNWETERNFSLLACTLLLEAAAKVVKLFDTSYVSSCSIKTTARSPTELKSTWCTVRGKTISFAHFSVSRS